VENLTFGWDGPGPLDVEMTKPIAQVSIYTFGSVRMSPHSLTLWRPDGSGLRIYSEMREVAERIEIGVLCFTHVKSPSEDEETLTIGPEFNQQNDAFKLLIHDEGVTAESGILLRARNGNEIAVLVGSFPLTIAIKGVIQRPHIFQPEYPMERLERLPIRVR